MTPTYTPINVKLSDLLLDPNNFRFQDEEGRGFAAENRFHEPKVQDSTTAYVRKDGVLDLKKSILANGFLPVERIVVRRYAHSEDTKYLVLEGNRRLAALRWIEADHENGITAPSDLVSMLEQLPVVLVDSEHDQSVYLSIMGIRHVGGIKEWGGYQSAKLVAELKDEHHLETPDVASRLGLSPIEVNRRYRAYKALDQMRHSDEYADQATTSLYAIFFEAISGTRVKAWLGWDDSKSEFTDEENRNHFYSLITDFDNGDGIKHQAKITKYLEVRELRVILDNPLALRSLLNLESSFSDASAEVKAASAASTWRANVSAATIALDKVGARELHKITPEDVDALNELIEIAGTVITASGILNVG